MITGLKTKHLGLLQGTLELSLLWVLLFFLLPDLKGHFVVLVTFEVPCSAVVSQLGTETSRLVCGGGGGGGVSKNGLGNLQETVMVCF